MTQTANVTLLTQIIFIGYRGAVKSAVDMPEGKLYSYAECTRL
jgi:hypothetical protein